MLAPSAPRCLRPTYPSLRCAETSARPGLIASIMSTLDAVSGGSADADDAADAPPQPDPETTMVALMTTRESVPPDVVLPDGSVMCPVPWEAMDSSSSGGDDGEQQQQHPLETLDVAGNGAGERGGGSRGGA